MTTTTAQLTLNGQEINDTDLDAITAEVGRGLKQIGVTTMRREPSYFQKTAFRLGLYHRIVNNDPGHLSDWAQVTSAEALENFRHRLPDEGTTRLTAQFRQEADAVLERATELVRSE